jgi:hypothetical protein
MTEPPTTEYIPTPRELEREARRLARVRHLTLVTDDGGDSAAEAHFVSDKLDPDPKEAA